MSSPPEWQRVEAALDEILDLPRERWGEALEHLRAIDPALHQEVASLVAHTEGYDPILDRPAGATETSNYPRKRPDARYEGTAALQQDIPFFRRHRWLIAAMTFILLLIIGGSVGIAIQAARARAEAARATAVKITDAWAFIYTQDFAKANQLLDHADRLLHEARVDDSALRGEWWLAKSRALSAQPGAGAERLAALQRAIDLYRRHDPLNSSYAAALANSANEYMLLGDYSQAATFNHQALEAAAAEPDRSDADMAQVQANLAEALAMLGQLDAAEAAYDKGADLVRATTGEQYSTYWYIEARHARLVHMRGDRARAMARFEALLKTIPADYKATTDDSLARAYFGERLAAEGRPLDAIAQLEAAQKPLTERPTREFDLPMLRVALGDACDRAGRSDEARDNLSAAVQEYLAREPHNSPDGLAARERLARFNLEHSGDAAARSAVRAELVQIIADAGLRAIDTSAVALAHADLARLAAGQKDIVTATSESELSQRALDTVRALHDVRDQSYVWRVRSEVATLRGDEPAARTWGRLVADADARYDAHL